MAAIPPSRFGAKWSVTVRSAGASPMVITAAMEAGGCRRTPAPVHGMAPVWRVRALAAGRLNASELAAVVAGTEPAFNKSPRRMSLSGLVYNRNDQLHVIVEAASLLSERARSGAMNSLWQGIWQGFFQIS